MTMTAPYAHLAWLTDGSERARAAAPWVERLARLGAEAVQVVMATGASNGEKLRAEARDRVAAAAATLQVGEVAVRPRVAPGQPAAVAQQLVDADGVDLVVCGRTGTSGLDRLLLGSTAQRLVRHLSCDVLVAERSEGVRLRTVLVPVDPTHLAQPALLRAHALAQSTRAELHLLVVTSERDPAALAEARRRLDAVAEPILSRRGRTPYRTVAAHASRTADGILRLAVGHDLVVMGTHGRSGLQRLLLGSVAEGVVARCPAPVLVARPRP